MWCKAAPTLRRDKMSPRVMTDVANMNSSGLMAACSAEGKLRSKRGGAAAGLALMCAAAPD